jgi:large subunit ribosomal protein L9
MKIILTAAVSNVGKIGDVVEVKNGYAKNFLIPNNKAICATANNSKIFESRRQEFEQANDKDLAIATSVKERISGKDVVILENASDDGRLYGSVNSTLISAKINEIVKEKVASRVNVFLKKPIKEVGVYSVQLSLHSDVVINLRLVVARSEAEVTALVKAEKKSEVKPEVKSEKAKVTTEVKAEEVQEESSEVVEEKPKKKKAKAA